MRQTASLNQSEEEIEIVPVDFEELKKINPVICTIRIYNTGDGD